MADEIEEFLRRAARRRQRAQRAEPARPGRPRAPEYTDRHAERAVREIELVEPDEVVAAEVVEPPSPREAPRPASEANERLAEHLRDVFDQGLGTFKPQEKVAAIETVRQLDPLTAVLRQLRRPGGMAEALILREILDRPSDRW